MDSLHQELDFQHLVDVKGGLETARSLCAGDQGDLPTGGAGDGRLVMALLDHQWLEALLAVRVKALEELGVCEGLKADGTAELVINLLESLFSCHNIVQRHTFSSAKT